MDIQNEVAIFLEQMENNEMFNVDIALEDVISKIKKSKNVKLFYKLLINKLNSKIINLFNNISTIEDIDKKNKQTISANSQLKIALRINEKYNDFKLKYKENKRIKTFNKIKLDLDYKYIDNNINDKENDCNELSPIQQEIYEKLNFDNDYEDYDIHDIIISFNYFIKNIDILNEKRKLLNSTNIVCEILYEYLYENPEIFIEFNYLIDNLNNEIRKYEKNSIERITLKEVSKKFIDIYNIYKNKIIKNNNNPYFALIDFWLNDENNYLFIKELIKRKPRLCNIYNNDKHIVIHILEKYIENFKQMINDKNSDYINKNYLKEIYFLFSKNEYLRISKKEREQVDMLIKDFTLYIKETLIKEKRKNAAIEELKTMKSYRFYKEEKEFDFREYTIDNITYGANRIYNNCISYANNKECNEAFLIGDKAYSIKEDENEININMYSLDIHMFAPKNSIIDSYFEKCEFENKNIDDLILRLFSFKLNKKYPTICYNLKFYKSGKFKELEVKKENIIITDEFKTFSNSDKFSYFIDLYSKSILKNGGTYSTYDLNKVNKHFENILNNEFIKFIKENRLPFIYCGYKLPTSEEISKNMNSLTPLLYNLEKDDAYEIINIVSTKIDRMHYSIYPIENAMYDLKLINPFNYIGLENQRMLGNIYFNEYDFIDENSKIKEKNSRLNKYDKIVRELNSNMDYVDPTEIKESKGKIKRRIKI